MAAYAMPALRFMPSCGEDPVWQKLSVAQLAVKIGCTSLAKLTAGGGPVRAATTSPTNGSTSGPTVEASPGSAHPPLRIRLGEGLLELVSGLAEAERVDGRPLAGRRRLTHELAARLLARRAELRRRAGATLVGAAVRQRRDEGGDRGIDDRLEVRGVVHRGATAFASAASNALENFSSAFVRHASSVPTPFLRALAWHASFPLNFLATAVSFLTAHFCSGVGPAWVTVGARSAGSR